MIDASVVSSLVDSLEESYTLLGPSTRLSVDVDWLFLLARVLLAQAIPASQESSALLVQLNRLHGLRRALVRRF